jgi:beta-lactam-binding protein with PASTA domain
MAVSALAVLGLGLGLGFALSSNVPSHRFTTPPTATAPAVHRPAKSHVTVPDVLGESPADAGLMLADIGLAERFSDPTRTGMVVVAQTPPAGSVVIEGSQVTITLSNES